MNNSAMSNQNQLNICEMSVNEIVREARNLTGLNQTKFAQSFDSKQSLISKYEGGVVMPPAKLLMQCVNICVSENAKSIQQEEMVEDMSEQDLVQLIGKHLQGESMKSKRYLIANLIQMMTVTFHID